MARAEQNSVCNGRSRLARKSASENTLTAKEHTGLGHHNLRGSVSNPCKMQRSYSKHGQRDTNASEGEPVRTETLRSNTGKQATAAYMAAMQPWGGLAVGPRHQRNKCPHAPRRKERTLNAASWTLPNARLSRTSTNSPGTYFYRVPVGTY